MLHELKPEQGSRHRTRRVGRGIGSGAGKTCGRGSKGQKSRNSIHPGFEGGQTPIHRRLPVKKGFRNPKKLEYAVVNVGVLEEKFSSSDEVTVDAVIKKGLIGDPKDGLKILGFGELKKTLRVTAHAFSKSAEEKIKSAGGEITRL